MPDLEALRAVFATAAANRHLGARLIEVSDARTVVAMPARTELIQENGVVHGGFVATLADTAAVYSVVSRLEDDRGLTGVEFKLNFMRPGRANGGEIAARAKLIKLGRTLAIVDVEVSQDDAMIAKGLFTYMITAPGTGRGAPRAPAGAT